ncbi:PRA1 family protein D [Glycine soja]|uniref:PRA1 family protein n=1 Tax=Glycine soja TaxID=3848 RepID=A0A0B2RK66_GLYSO|nr:PRA1 family protein D [Glycine soja]
MSSINPSRATAPSAFATRRPWEEFFALHSFTRPYTLGETTLRVKRNLGHFRVNYAMVVLLFVFLSLLWFPISLVVFLAVFAAWFFLYFFLRWPIVVLRRELDDGLVLSGVWVNVVGSGIVGVGVVVLHAAFRSTEDLYVDELEVSDGGLVSVVGGSPTKRTGFTYRVVSLELE